jgi:hypothetical protein
MQINHTFDSSLEHRVQKPFCDRFDEMRRSLLLDVRGATQNLNEGTQNLNEACMNLRQTMSAIQDRGTAAPPPVEVDPEVEIDRLLDDGQVEEAFQFALSQSDVQLVANLCKKQEASILNARPAVLSQPSLCSLVQQLGFDLEVEQELKMSWLQSALLVLDSKDAVTAKMLPHILSDLATSLAESFRLHAAPTDPAHNSFKLMMHLVSTEPTPKLLLCCHL